MHKVRRRALIPNFNMESSHEQRLRLVDINQLTVKQTWPHLLDAVQRAHFISVDLVSIRTHLHVHMHAKINAAL